MKKSALSILQQIRRSVGSVFLVLLGIIFLTGLLPSSLQKVYAEERKGRKPKNLSSCWEAI